MASRGFRVGQRIKFEPPESLDPSLGELVYPRGRVLHIDHPLIQVLEDGKAFAQWLDLRRTEVLPE